MISDEKLEKMRRRHVRALRTVGGNQGIKAYALEARADVLTLIDEILCTKKPTSPPAPNNENGDPLTTNNKQR